MQTGENFTPDHSRFIFSVKKEIIRDLVMFPMPQCYLSNKQMIQLPLFWATMIFTSRMLKRQAQQKNPGAQQTYPVDAIAINFGQWETAGSYDRRLVDCHAHAHLLTYVMIVFINH